MSVTHTNTNNYHLHIAVNRIDPDGYKRARLPFSKVKLQKKAIELEEKHNLKRDNHGRLAEHNRKTNNIQNTKEEITYERRNSRTTEYTTEQRVVSLHKSHIAKPKRRTKTQKLSSVRKLSECDMVHHPKRIEVLVQHNERDSMGEQREASNQLRREGTGDYGDVSSTGSEPINQKAEDIKSHTGMKNFTQWVKEQAGEDIKATLTNKTSSLIDLHRILAKYNLELKERGNGLVIADKTRKLFCKASDIHRELSKAKLENKFGTFHPMHIDVKATSSFGVEKTEYWEKYQQAQNSRKTELASLKTERQAYLEELKKTQKREIENLKSSRVPNKKRLYENMFASHKRIRELSKAVHDKKKADINNKNPYMSYKEYLIAQAMKGDVKALQTLRNTKPSTKPKEDENIIEGKANNNLWISKNPMITKEGHVVYKLDKENDFSKIIDKGKHLKVVNASDAALLETLKMAKMKYGNTLEISGTDEFKSKIINLALENQLDISFKDKKMQEVLDGAREGGEKHNNTQKSENLGR